MLKIVEKKQPNNKILRITEGYVWIYDINGVLVKTLPATGERMEIRLQERGIYLVKYAGRTVKVKI